MEFADFECPFCGTVHGTLKAVRERYPAAVAVYFLHYPLSSRRFAMPAARAAECADEQGRCGEMHDKLFEQQATFGNKPWTEFAAEARVSHLAAFQKCVQGTDIVPRIAEGLRLGRSLNIPGTPTLVVNGWQLGRPLTLDELDQMVQAILTGRSPIAGSRAGTQ